MTYRPDWTDRDGTERDLAITTIKIARTMQVSGKLTKGRVRNMANCAVRRYLRKQEENTAGLTEEEQFERALDLLQECRE